MGGQGYDLGQVYGKIVLDASGLQDGVNKARQSLASGFTNMGDKVQAFGDQLTGLGARITALSAPFAAFSASGLNVASDFDALMKQIELFGGVTGAELEEVRQFALKWGADTKFSAQDTGQAFLDLLKSGMDLEEAMATLPDVLNLAAAGDISLAQSAGIASGALAMFQMEVGGMNDALVEVPPNFIELQNQLGITDTMFTDFGNGMELAQLDRMASQLGVTTDELYDMWNATKPLTPEMKTLANQLGITRSDWRAYNLYLEGAYTATQGITPAIQELIEQTGLSGQRLNELFSVQVPPNFKELQDELGLTNDMFTGWGDTYPIEILDEFASRLGVTSDEIYEMWQKTITLTPEMEALSESLGLSAEDWIALNEAAGTTEYFDKLKPAMQEVAESLGLHRNHIAELFADNEKHVSSSSRVVDALAQAANASRADIADLGQALTNVGPIANTFGLDVQETAAVLAVFAQNGIKGAESGTQLKSMLLNLSRPTDDVKEAYTKLGVSLYDASGNVRDFNEFILDLDSALDALPVQEQNEMMQRLGGSYGILGLTALRASNGIGDMLDKMEAAPEAGLLATEMMNTFQGKVISLQGSIETLKIEAFTPFMNEVLKPFIDRMIVLVNNMAQWAKENPELTKTIIQIGSAVVLAGPALMGLGFAINNIGFAIKAFAPVVGLLTSPLGLMAGAGLALAHVFDVDLRQAFEDILATARPVLESLREWFVTEGLPAINNFIQNTFLPTVHRIGEIIGQIWTTVAPILSQLFNWFVTQGLPAISNFIQKTFIPGVQRIGEIIGEVWEEVAPILAELFTWFVEDALPAINEIIQEVFIPLIQDIGRRIGEVWSAIYPVLVQLYNWFVTTALPAISNFIQTVFIPAVEGIAHIFKEIYETVAPILQYIFTWFAEQGIPIIARIINEIVVPVFETLFDVLGDIWEVVAPALQSFLDWFQSTGWPFIQSIIDNVITPAINWVITLLAGIWEAISPHIENLKEFLEAAFIWIDENVFTHIENVINGFIDIVEGIWTAIQPHLDTLKTTFETAFNWIKTEVFEKIIGPAIQGFIDFIGRVWKDIEPFLNDLKAGFDAAFKWIDTYVIQPIIQVIKSIPNAIKEVEDAINRFLHGNPANKVGETAKNILAPGALTNMQQGITTGNFAEDMRQSGRTYMPGIGVMGAIPLPPRDSGGIGLADMPYLIGKPQENNEIFVPRATGDFIPNFMEKMDALFERENTPSIGTVVIHANTEEGGRAAARGFVNEFERTLRSKG